MKKIPLFVCVLLLITCTNVFAINVMVNEDEVTFTNDTGSPFVDENQRTQVPLRVTMEAFGAEVEWDDANNTAIVTKNGNTVEVPVGKNYISLNGSTIQTDTKALIKEGKTYLPIRPVAESLGAKIFWDQDTSTVVLSSNKTDMYVVDATGSNAGFKLLKNHSLKDKINIFYKIEKDGDFVYKQIHYELLKDIKMSDTIKWTNLDGNTVTSTRKEIYALLDANVLQSQLFSEANSKYISFGLSNPYNDNIKYISENAKEFYDDWANTGTAMGTEAEIIVSEYINGFN